MKHVLTLTLAGALALTTVGLCAAQPKAERRGATEEERVSKKMCGTVTKVDAKAKTFSISAKGKEVTFDAAQVQPLPKRGDTVDVTYLASGDPLKGLNVSKSKS
jgi:hypothetical protein